MESFTWLPLASRQSSFYSKLWPPQPFYFLPFPFSHGFHIILGLLYFCRALQFPQPFLSLPFPFLAYFFSDNFPNPFSSYPSPFRPTHLTIPPTLSLCANYFTMLIWILQPRLQAHNNIQCNQYKVKGFLSHQYV